MQQHQIVYAALRGRMGGELHALALQTSAPAEASEFGSRPIGGAQVRKEIAMTTAFERIESDIKANPVVLYMKGTPVFPQCGFSARVVQILSHLGVPFKGVNVLEDMEIREGIKAYTTGRPSRSSMSAASSSAAATSSWRCSRPASWPQLMKDKGIPVSAEA